MYFELYYEVFQGWRWTLYAANHKKIANSGEGYINKSDALAAIGLVKACGNAPVRERTTA
ncbi:YegP family protein [Tabrizicola sp.]|uniref:YegP family protein n=1 Tax=Tabrizicola sp. TaxID=2005166 RepID=UPI002FDCBA1F